MNRKNFYHYRGVFLMLRGHLSKNKGLILAVISITLVSSSIPTNAQNQVPYEGPGFDYSFPGEHMLFLKGDEDTQFLDRNWTTVTGLPTGSASFSKTSSFTLPTIVDSYSSPTIEPFSFEGNITVRLFASLESTSNACSLSNTPLGGPLGSETQFSITLGMGSFEPISQLETEPIVMSKDRTDPHIFEVSAKEVNISMNSGDRVHLSIQVRHECALSGTLWWGTYDSRTGISLEGDLIDADLNVVVDQNRIARIEYTPISPWGLSDFPSQSIELVGPVPWDEMQHGYYDEYNWADHFELPDGISKGESNRSVRIWMTDRPLEPGNYMLDACMRLSDQDPGDLCPSWAILRFSVPQDKSPILSSSFAVALISLGIISWLGVSIRGASLPLPAYGVILLLTLSSIATTSELPDLDDEYYREGGAAPNFILLSHDPSSAAVSLSELMGNSDVIVLGLFTSGSPNAENQKDDFEAAEKILALDGYSATFVQIATGDGVKAYNLDEFAGELNGSWPLLLDDGTVGRSLPSGPTDAVLVIDSAGFIVSWSPGSMAPSNIHSATETASLGSGNSPFSLFSMLVGTALLPLIVLGMPSERNYDSPEEPLIPGVGAVMTIFAASFGFMLWAAPISLLSAIGLGLYWTFVQLILSIILAYHGVSMLSRGRIIEIEKATSFVHKRLSEKYREWRPLSRFSEDVYLGLWLAWISWLIQPTLIAQGVGSLARSGLLGLAISPLFLFSFVISAGFVVLILRSVSLVFGSYSRILGMISLGVRPRAWGLIVGIMGAWTLFSIILGPLSPLI
ncbi:MAG: hypothetical protein VX621_05625 [Candidatus Thermoplasmatota archaeon]|nr:hypothetical protein [Candidatus Thermoplasmatota archaeon]